MKRCHLRLVLILGCVLILSLTQCREVQQKKPVIGADIAKIINSEEGDPKRITNEVQRNLIEPLMKLAAGKREDGCNTPKEIAINLLGEFRVVEAVEMLIDDIDYHPPGIDWGELPIMHFPCARALINIGLPSIELMFERLGAEEFNEKHYVLYAWVIHLIYDDELSSGEMGEHRIRKELEKVADDEFCRKRLQKLLEVYKAKNNSEGQDDEDG